MPIFRSATDDELSNLRAFDGSYEVVAHRVDDNQDILANWWILGVEPVSGQYRIVLLERSTDAFAFVVGDGVHFGRAAAPREAEVPELVARYGLRFG
jgi:hypothetical protein